MANTTVTAAICDLCGAEIRDGSLYCYNCGTAVQAKQSDAEVVVPVKPEVPVAPVRHDDRPPLRSAASLRKQRRASNRQPVEVRWEPRTETPTGFIIASVAVAIIALVLLLIAMYLR